MFKSKSLNYEIDSNRNGDMIVDEKKLRDSFEQALKVKEAGSGRLFFDELMDFEFHYDEEEEKVVIHVPVTKIMHNPVGFLHGGVMTYIADTAMGHLCAVFSKPSVSLELKTQFFKTVKEGTIKATAYFVKKGRTVQFIECTLEDEKDQLIAKVTATFYTIS